MLPKPQNPALDQMHLGSPIFGLLSVLDMSKDALRDRNVVNSTSTLRLTKMFMAVLLYFESFVDDFLYHLTPGCQSFAAPALNQPPACDADSMWQGLSEGWAILSYRSHVRS